MWQQAPSHQQAAMGYVAHHPGGPPPPAATPAQRGYSMQ
jgi:hypothetical protein